MTRKLTTIAAGAIGSAAIAAALLYAGKRNRDRDEKDKKAPQQLPPIPSGEQPETD